MADSVDNMIVAINNLTGAVGEIKGEFKGLKRHIETQVGECRSNYKTLNENFDSVRRKLNGVTTKDEIVDKLRRRVTDKRLNIYNTIKLICIIVTSIIAVLGIDYWRAGYKLNDNTKIYTQADANSDQATILAQIQRIESYIKTTRDGDK